MDNEGYIVANSRTPPAPTDKFMITMNWIWNMALCISIII
jgi:hypothetical protein